MGFSVSGGQIIGPNDRPFKAQGVDILDATVSSVVGDPSGGALLKSFPDTNFVRLMLWSGYQLGQSAINAIDWLTARGIVVEICNYNGWPTVPTGSQLTQEVNFFSQIATTYKNNPYVWFNTENEPQDTSIGLPAGSITAEQVAVYNAIRATGNTNMVGFDLTGGYSTNGLNPPAYASMTNVFWDQHYYDWMSNYSSDVGANQNSLASEIASDQSIHSADGIMPVIVGEFGNATDGANTDPGATQAVQAVLKSRPTIQRLFRLHILLADLLGRHPWRRSTDQREHGNTHPLRSADRRRDERGRSPVGWLGDGHTPAASELQWN